MSDFTQKIIHFFHLGRLPDQVRTQLTSEGGIAYLAEGIAATAILNNFRVPGVYCSHRKMTFIGFFALSTRRIALRAKCYHKIDINMTFDDPKFQQLRFQVYPNYLSLTFDPAVFIPEASGQIEIRLHISNMSQAVDILKQNNANMSPETITS